MPSKKSSTTKTVKAPKPKVKAKENHQIKIEVFYMATLFIALCGILLVAINKQSQAAAPEKSAAQMQDNVYRSY
jgi:hypothetical protein